MAVLLIPTALRLYTNGLNEIEVEGSSVAEALGHLITLYTDLEKHLFNDEGKLRSYINIYVNEEDIRQKERLNTPLKGDETILLIPSIAGGKQ